MTSETNRREVNKAILSYTHAHRIQIAGWRKLEVRTLSDGGKSKRNLTFRSSLSGSIATEIFLYLLHFAFNGWLCFVKMFIDPLDSLQGPFCVFPVLFKFLEQNLRFILKFHCDVFRKIWTESAVSYFNTLNTKRRVFYLKIQFVPRSKHFSSRL